MITNSHEKPAFPRTGSVPPGKRLQRDKWGVIASFMLFDRLVGYSRQPTFFSPKSARAYLFPQSVKIITFAAAPLALTPFVRNQREREHVYIYIYIYVYVCM